MEVPMQQLMRCMPSLCVYVTSLMGALCSFGIYSLAVLTVRSLYHTVCWNNLADAVQGGACNMKAARQAFTDSMLGMTATINALVHDNLRSQMAAAQMSSWNSCKTSALRQQKCGLHKQARQVQPREYIAGKKRLMSVDFTARKQQRLSQTEQPKAIECSAP